MDTAAGVVIWGAGGHAAVVADILERQCEFEVVGHIDDVNPDRKGDRVGTHTILGGREVLNSLRSRNVTHLIVAVGDNRARCDLAAFALGEGFELATAMHPASTISAGATLGPGSVVAAGGVVNPASRIGSNAIVNTCASVDHDCLLGDGVHVGPGARLAGHVRIGAHTTIGVGAVFRDRVSVGAECVIGAGSVVLRDIPDGVVAFGCPARVVREVDRSGSTW